MSEKSLFLLCFFQVCKVETDEEMVCQVPSIQSKVMVEADIGLTLDGVTLYRNLSSALPEKGAFRFCLEPQFFKGVAEANSKGKERSITLQVRTLIFKQFFPESFCC